MKLRIFDMMAKGKCPVCGSTDTKPCFKRWSHRFDEPTGCLYEFIPILGWFSIISWARHYATNRRCKKCKFMFDLRD